MVIWVGSSAWAASMSLSAEEYLVSVMLDCVFQLRTSTEIRCLCRNSVTSLKELEFDVAESSLIGQSLGMTNLPLVISRNLGALNLVPLFTETIFIIENISRSLLITFVYVCLFIYFAMTFNLFDRSYANVQTAHSL